MVQNLYSLGLLRNGKVYANKQLAMQGLTQSATNDGVAKLARYLYQPTDSNEKIIRTLVGFYANAAEMEDNGGGQSYYTILDVEGSAADIQHLQQEINEINNLIGNGIAGKTLTQAINEANSAIEKEVSDREEAIDALDAALKKALTISLEVASTPTEGYLKTYVLSQGTGDSKTEIGKIDIPKDMVVSGGSLVHGTWSGDTFTEDPEGPDTAIKIEFANKDVVYLNTKDLVDFYTGGDGITVDNTANTISIKINSHTEEFLVLDANGLRVEGIHSAIDNAVEAAKLSAGEGISINANKVTAVAASFSKEGIKNPISVDKNGIKFSSILDCGFFDSTVVIANNAAAIEAITNPSDTDVFISSEDAVESLAKGNGKTFKSIAIGDAALDTTVELNAENSIEMDGLNVSGTKDNGNGKILYTAPAVNVKNVNVANGSTVYNVFEGTQDGTATDSFIASEVTVDNTSLKHNVFNIYKMNNDAEITIKDSYFNVNVNNSNILRLSNNIDATGVTVNFENIDWTYENTPSSADFDYAGLIMYQPYKSTDGGLNGDLTAMKTWKFNFKNCKYNGVKVDGNNFGEHNQVFYMYNVGNDGSIIDPVANGLTLNFE